MLAEAGGAIAEPRTSAVAVIAALEVERRCFRGGASVSAVRVSGPGEANAAAAAAAAIEAGAGGLISFGLCGGLAPDVASGCLVLPNSILMSDGRRISVDQRWRARIAAAVEDDFMTDGRPLLAAAEIIDTPATKARAAASGAAAVDLESGAIAAAAAKAGLPFVAVRAVADAAGDALPAGIATWVDAKGRSRAAPFIGAALKPINWPALVTLVRRWGTARRTLERVAQRLSERAFLIE